jgi:hypothetical protein
MAYSDGGSGIEPEGINQRCTGRRREAQRHVLSGEDEDTSALNLEDEMGRERQR